MHNLIQVLLLNSFLLLSSQCEAYSQHWYYINAVSVWNVFCKYSSHRIESPYHSISHLLQKSEAFQSVHHVVFILCYTVLYNFLVLRFATVGAKRASTGCPAPLFLPLSEFVNTHGGAYQQAISVLYAVAYTLKMSYKTDYKIEGFFEYVVPPLEGFWWQDDVEGVDYTNKSAFNWISVIRLPDFISKADFDWAVETATKKLDCSSAEYLTIDEGLCVQIMHIGSFDNEPATVALMDAYLEQNGYADDIDRERLHHEIYMSDARRVAPEKWKTVIRHPIKKA